MPDLGREGSETEGECLRDGAFDHDWLVAIFACEDCDEWGNGHSEAKVEAAEKGVVERSGVGIEVVGEVVGEIDAVGLRALD